MFVICVIVLIVLLMSIVSKLMIMLFCSMNVVFDVCRFVMIMLLSLCVVIVELIVVVLRLIMIVRWMLLMIIGNVSGSLMDISCCYLFIFILCVVLMMLCGMFLSFVIVFLKIGRSLYNMSVISMGFNLKLIVGIVSVSMVIGGKVWLILMMLCVIGRKLVLNGCVIVMFVEIVMIVLIRFDSVIVLRCVSVRLSRFV